MQSPNPPAFPRPASQHEEFESIEPVPAQSGMTLRDWFAGMALAGMCADSGRDGSHGDFAVDAYAFADAMLDVRAMHDGEEGGGA